MLNKFQYHISEAEGDPTCGARSPWPVLHEITEEAQRPQDTTNAAEGTTSDLHPCSATSMTACC